MFAIIISLSITVYGIILNGWALVKLWSWFIVPTFHLPGLTIPAAIGLGIVTAYLTHQVSIKNFRDEMREEIELWERIGYAFLYGTAKPLLAVVFGWIINMWM